MRAVCYARVSSVAQRDRDTIASQLRDLPAFVERQGWTLSKPVETYVDDGHTAKAGHLAKRTGLAAMLLAAAAGEFDVVVVADVDRLTRSEDLVERGLVLGSLQRAGVKIASVNSGQITDPKTSMGDLMLTLHGFFAAEENRKRGSRTVAGKLTAIARGRKPAGPTPYGLTYSRATWQWGIDDEAADVVREIYHRVAAGESCETIAADLHARGIPRPRSGEWQRERVWAIANSMTYRGTWTADKARGLTIEVPRIVSEDLARAAVDTLAAWGKRGRARARHVYLFERLAVCACCGASISIQSATGPRSRPNTQARYICSRRRRPRRGATPCAAPTAVIREVDDRAWTAIARELQDPNLVAWVMADRRSRAAEAHDWARDLEGYRAHLARLARHETAVLSRARRGLVSEDGLDRELTAARRERDMVAAQVKVAEQARTAGYDAEAAIETAERALADLRMAAGVASPEERRDLLRAFVEPRSAVMDDGRMRITLRVATPPDRVGSASGPGYSSVAETIVRIRLLA